VLYKSPPSLSPRPMQLGVGPMVEGSEKKNGHYFQNEEALWKKDVFLARRVKEEFPWGLYIM